MLIQLAEKYGYQNRRMIEWLIKWLMDENLAKHDLSDVLIYSRRNFENVGKLLKSGPGLLLNQKLKRMGVPLNERLGFYEVEPTLGFQ